MNVIITTRLSRTKSVITPIVTLFICIIMVSLFLYFWVSMHEGNKYINQVRSSHPESYPTITYDDAFNKYFNSPKWEYKSGDNNEHIVVFTGKSDGKNVELQYLINQNGETFSLTGGSIDGVKHNLFEMALINSAAFMNY